MDFLTGRPPLDSNTTILFSKAVHYIPLHKLPSLAETGELLVLHVVRLHRIPSDIVFQCGSQFSSQLWRVICQAQGSSASLSSGYHLQTNRQMEKAIQYLGAALQCMTSHNPASRSKLLP